MPFILPYNQGTGIENIRHFSLTFEHKPTISDPTNNPTNPTKKTDNYCHNSDILCQFW